MLATFFVTLLLSADEPANPLLNELLDKGIPVPAGPTVRLPDPWMKEGLSPQEQQHVLKKAAGNLPLELFVKKSDAAPFTLKINSVDNSSGKRVAQTIDLFFVAHGNLDRAIKEDVVNQLLGTDAKKDSEVRLLGEKALAERGIKLLHTANLEERYAGLDVFLLDRVKITGVTRNVMTHGPGCAVMAMQLDPRFASDKQYPNRWRSFNPLAAKNDAFGPPQPYSGMGGYARVTRLDQNPSALFFEVHAGFHEPEGWFGGPNLLRSKLPLVIQENIRNLRRKLGRE
jgi:hypothetical protein